MRAFAPEAAAGGRPKRKFQTPSFSYESWRASLGGAEAGFTVPASAVDTSKTLIIGSMDVGSVSFGWSVVRVAPLATAYAAQAAQGEARWVRVPHFSEAANVSDEALPAARWTDYAFELVEWRFESFCERGRKMTKAEAVDVVVRDHYKRILERFDALGVRMVLVEQQLGAHNILATCLSHVCQAMVRCLHPDWAFHSVAPQLTLRLFLSYLSLVPKDFAFGAAPVRDLKQKDQKKYASSCCAALALVGAGAIADGDARQAVWTSVPRAPDPKYDDISDSMWNAVAYWLKHVMPPPPRGTKRKRQA